MADIFTCTNCTNPWIDKKEYSGVFDSLNSLPIGWCDCIYPELSPIEYGQGEFREAYYLALSDTMSDEGANLSVLLDEDVLQELQWVRRRQQDWWLTAKGRRLLPLCLMVATDLHKS